MKWKSNEHDDYWRIATAPHLRRDALIELLYTAGLIVREDIKLAELKELYQIQEYRFIGYSAIPEADLQQYVSKRQITMVADERPSRGDLLDALLWSGGDVYITRMLVRQPSFRDSCAYALLLDEAIRQNITVVTKICKQDLVEALLEADKDRHFTKLFDHPPELRLRICDFYVSDLCTATKHFKAEYSISANVDVQVYERVLWCPSQPPLAHLPPATYRRLVTILQTSCDPTRH